MELRGLPYCAFPAKEFFPKEHSEYCTKVTNIITAALWVCVVLAPHSRPSERHQWQRTLEQWAQTDVCPLEDPDHRHQDNTDRVRI